MTVEEALEKVADGESLHRADLCGADLHGANLCGAEGVDPRLHNHLLAMFCQPGKIRAYKLVTKNGKGPTYPSLTYEVGMTLKEQNYNSDPFVDCGAGLNLATLPWCMQRYTPGMRILVAEFTAKDIVAIPWFSDGKFRVKRCKIVDEVDFEPNNKGA